MCDNVEEPPEAFALPTVRDFFFFLSPQLPVLSRALACTRSCEVFRRGQQWGGFCFDAPQRHRVNALGMPSLSIGPPLLSGRACRLPAPPPPRLPQAEKLEVFAEYIKDLEKAEAAKKTEEKEKQRRQERKHREAFRALLEEKRAQGLITARTVWKAFEKEIEGEEALMLMRTNLAGSRPKARSPKARDALCHRQRLLLL